MSEPEQTKALLRLLIKELRVNGRSEIRLTYRVVTPEACAMTRRGPGARPLLVDTEWTRHAPTRHLRHV